MTAAVTAVEGATWVDVEDAELAKDDVPVSRDIRTGWVLGLQAVTFVASAAVLLGLRVFGLRGPTLVLASGVKLLSAAVALVVIQRLGWERRVGLRTPRRWARLGLAWAPAAYVFVAFAPGFPDRTPGQALGILGLCAAVALDEELWARGLLLESLRWRGTTAAVLLSSAWFGLLHGVNVLGGQPASTTGVQMGVAAAFGLALGAVRVRTHSIWPGIAVHLLWDFALILRSGDIGTDAGSTASAALVGLLVFAPLALHGLVLSRPSMVPGPDGRMRRRRVPVAPWRWPVVPGQASPTVDALGRWPAPPEDLQRAWYGRGARG